MTAMGIPGAPHHNRREDAGMSHDRNEHSQRRARRRSRPVRERGEAALSTRGVAVATSPGRPATRPANDSRKARRRSLTPEERVKFDNCITGYINIVEVTLYHTEQGRIEEVLEMVSGNFGLRYFSYPGANEWWDHCEKLAFADSTRQWVDDLAG